MIVATVFGLTRGFESIIYAGKGKEFPFDPPNEYIQSAVQYVKPSFDHEFFMVRRFSVTEGVLTFIGVYRGVYEIGYERPNSYYGAGLWLLNRTVDGKLVQTFLTNLADQIKNSAISENRFIKTLADTSLKISSSDFAKLENTNQPNAEGLGTDDSSEQCFIQAQHDASHLINWAQVGFAAQYFNRIYAGNPVQMTSATARADTPQLFLSTGEATEACLYKLTNKYDELFTQKQRLSAKIKDSKDQVKLSRDDLAIVTQERKNFETSLENLSARYTQLDNKYNDLKREIESLTTQNESLKANLGKDQKSVKPSAAEGLARLENKQPTGESGANIRGSDISLWLLLLLTLSLPIHTILSWLINPNWCFAPWAPGLRPDVWLSLGALWLLLSSLVLFFSKDWGVRVLSILLIGLLVGISAFYLDRVFPSVVCTNTNNIPAASSPAASTSALPPAPTTISSTAAVLDKGSNNIDAGNTKPSASSGSLSNQSNSPSSSMTIIDLKNCVGDNTVLLKTFKMTHNPTDSAPVDINATLGFLQNRLARCVNNSTKAKTAKCSVDLQGFTEKWQLRSDSVSLIMPDSCAETYSIPINPKDTKDAKKIIEYRFEIVKSGHNPPP